METLQDNLKVIDELEKLLWEGQGSEPDFRKIKHQWYEFMQFLKEDIKKQNLTDEEKDSTYNFISKITALWIKLQENRHNGLAYYDMPEKISLKSLMETSLKQSGYKEDKLDN